MPLAHYMHVKRRHSLGLEMHAQERHTALCTQLKDSKKYTHTRTHTHARTYTHTHTFSDKQRAAGCKFNANALRLQVSSLARRCMSRYHDGWLKCSDDTCAHRTRNVVCDVHVEGDKAEMGLRCPQPGCNGRMQLEYTAESLYLQVPRLRLCLAPLLLCL
jgi:hypothetical protein